MASITPYAEGKEHILFVYDTPMAFQIHFCLTINGKIYFFYFSDEKIKEIK